MTVGKAVKESQDSEMRTGSLRELQTIEWENLIKCNRSIEHQKFN